MRITSDTAYRDAIAEMHSLTGPDLDTGSEQRRLELQAAIETYAEELHGRPDARKGKPRQGSA